MRGIMHRPGRIGEFRKVMIYFRGGQGLGLKIPAFSQPEPRSAKRRVPTREIASYKIKNNNDLTKQHHGLRWRVGRMVSGTFLTSSPRSAIALGRIWQLVRTSASLCTRAPICTRA